MIHPLNWTVGWVMILLGFLTGAGLGLRFHNDGFLGGYTSFRRRIIRLGHIALAALGVINVVYSLSPLPQPGNRFALPASVCFIAGGVLMPMTCFLTGWRAGFRRFFFVPVIALVLAVVFTLIGALP